jgi:ATP-dependent protease HslVU (ClpYQ) peptidase subunit
MSTIVVARTKNTICIGADTLVYTGLGSIIRPGQYSKNPSKIIFFKDTYIGWIGSTRGFQCLDKFLHRHSQMALVEGNEMIGFVAELLTFLKDECGLRPIDDDSSSFESLRGELLVASAKGIFGIDLYGAVTEFESYWAKGSGSEIALGSLYSSYPFKNVQASVQLALEACATFDSYTARPFTLFEITV